MNGPLFWVAATGFCVAALFSARRQRRQRTRLGFASYRNASLPAVLRNATPAGTLLVSFATPLVAAAAVLSLIPGLIDGVPTKVVTTLLFGAIGYLFLIFGATLVVAYRPPEWVVPRWLRDEDRAIGFEPPPPDWFDRLLLVLAIPFIVGGVAFALASVAALFWGT